MIRLQRTREKRKQYNEMSEVNDMCNSRILANHSFFHNYLTETSLSATIIKKTTWNLCYDPPDINISGKIIINKVFYNYQLKQLFLNQKQLNQPVINVCVPLYLKVHLRIIPFRTLRALENPSSQHTLTIPIKIKKKTHSQPLIPDRPLSAPEEDIRFCAAYENLPYLLLRLLLLHETR